MQVDIITVGSEETRQRILLERILLALGTISGQLGTIVFGATQKLEFTTTEGVNTYTFPALIGKTLVMEYSDGILRDTGVITLDNTIGEVTIAGDVSEGVSIVLMYR
jgi:hypothetical protein